MNEHFQTLPGLIRRRLQQSPHRLPDILQYPVEHILRYWDEKLPEYDRRIFDKGEPYNFEYFLDFVPCLKDKAVRDRLAAKMSLMPQSQRLRGREKLK